MDQLTLLRRDLERRTGAPIELGRWNRSARDEPRWLKGAAFMLPRDLGDPRVVDRHSLMESEFMFLIATLSADDYRLFHQQDPSFAA